MTDLLEGTDQPTNERMLTLDRLRHLIGDGSVDTVIMAFTDMQGRLMGKRLHAAYFLDVALAAGTEGCNYLLAVDVEMNTVDGYAISSWERGYGDMEFVPDWSTLRLVTHLPGTAMVQCDLMWPEDHSPVVESPRQILRAQLTKARDLGFTAHAGTELEFIAFETTFEEAHDLDYRGLRPVNQYNIDYSVLGTTRVEPLLRDIRNHMYAAGMDVESAKGECNLGQHEIGFLYNEALVSCDNHVVYKNAAKEIAAQHGKSLTFMAKYDEREGNSCHIHLSLRGLGGELVFWDQDKDQRTPLYDQFITGTAGDDGRLHAALRAQRQLLQAVRSRLVRAHRGRLGPGQPDLRDPPGRLWSLGSAGEPGPGRGRQPLPGGRGDDRRRSLRDREEAEAGPGDRGQRLRGRPGAGAAHAARGPGRVRRVGGRPGHPRGRRGGPLHEHGRRGAQGVRVQRHRLGAPSGLRAAVSAPSDMSSSYTVRDPSTGAPLTEVAMAGVAEADAAIERSHQAFATWRHVAPGERAALLRRFATVVDAHVEELAGIEVRNAGHTWGNARWEAGNVRDCLNYYAGAPERLFGRQIPVPGGTDLTFHEPLGVVGIIVPWNFPMPVAGWGMAPALAAGNTVVLKPAELTPLTAIRIGELALEAGLPEHVLTVLPGEGPVVGARFVTHPLVRKVCFTGSTRVGKQIMAGCADQVKRVTLELGGKSSNIVFADADIAAAAASAPYAVFDNAGQDCCARSRILVRAQRLHRVPGPPRAGGDRTARAAPRGRGQRDGSLDLRGAAGPRPGFPRRGGRGLRRQHARWRRLLGAAQCRPGRRPRAHGSGARRSSGRWSR